MQKILKGMRVVEGSAFVAAPSGGMTLAQLGADVIRFDQLGGGIDYKRWPLSDTGKSLYWNSLNKGKRSIAVDFRNKEGRELVQRLIAEPGEDNGLFVTNFPAKGFLSDEILRAKRNDLIYVNLTGDRKGGSAVDYTVNSRIGLPYLTGEGEKPINNPFPVWDVLAGQQIAVALLAAERHRSKFSEGQFVKIALADVAMATMGHLGYIAEAQLADEGRKAIGNHIFGTFGHDFTLKDGCRVMIVGISHKQWNAIVKVTQTENEILSLEKELDLDFYDIDQQIEIEFNSEISKIFRNKGEKIFRDIEEKTTLKVLKNKNIVIALGGGAFLNRNIRNEILKNLFSNHHLIPQPPAIKQ